MEKELHGREEGRKIDDVKKKEEVSVNKGSAWGRKYVDCRGGRRRRGRRRFLGRQRGERRMERIGRRR